jgi:hypothetical protein
MYSSGMEVCEVGALRRSDDVCKSKLQLFNIAYSGEEWRRECRWEKIYVK